MVTNSEPPAATFASQLIAPLTVAIYCVIGLSFAFLLLAPAWAMLHQTRKMRISVGFRRGLHITFGLLAIVLPAQGVVLALALYVADPHELWFWGIFVVVGSVGAIIILFTSGLGENPGIYLTLRARRLDLEHHFRLYSLLKETAEQLNVPLPAHILVGLQPELLTTSSTVFCPDGELEGGVVCLSLPACSLLSIPEFSAMLGEALLRIHDSTVANEKDFLSTNEAAADVARSLDASRKEWSWLPKWGIHPFVLALRLVLVATMKFPLYIGREWIAFYGNEFMTLRQRLDAQSMLQAHSLTATSGGAVNAITALVKEVSLTLAPELLKKDKPSHPLSEIAFEIAKQHPEMLLDRRVSSMWNPDQVWRFLQFRCQLAGTSLEWCRRLAFNLAPEPDATSLFQAPKELRETLLQVALQPLVVAKSASSAR